MQIFLEAPRSGQLRFDPQTGEMWPQYRGMLERDVNFLQSFGHFVCCPLSESDDILDKWAKFDLDLHHLRESDALLAYADPHVSADVQTSIGYALALGKEIVIASSDTFTTLPEIDTNILASGYARHVPLPLEADPFLR